MKLYFPNYDFYFSCKTARTMVATTAVKRKLPASHLNRVEEFWPTLLCRIVLIKLRWKLAYQIHVQIFTNHSTLSCR